MPNVANAYCAESDLRIGDLEPPSYTTKEQYVIGAAEEIDAAIGGIYVTPVVIEALPVNRPSILLLKKVNWLLASGRLVLDIAAAGEHDNQHAYGRSMVVEAAKILKDIVDGEIVLVGAEKNDTGDAVQTSGPTITNVDQESLVEGFYRNMRPGPYGMPNIRPAVTPYGP